MELKFLPGDLVVHKTGGPQMCVLDADTDEVKCSFWDDVQCVFVSVTFDTVELEPWPENACCQSA
jgi:uncharacterized protein YodC (DUF2158 family)